jgi:hypothetical protein
MTRAEDDLAAVRELKRLEHTQDLGLAARRCVLPLLESATDLGGICLPVDLDTIASIAQVREVRPVDDLSVAGLVRPHPDSDRALLIETRASDLYERQRFTIAHEIAHTRMPGFWADPSRSRTDRATGEFPRNSPLEVACDVAASEILLPRSLAESWMEGRPFDMVSLTDLAAEGEVSLSACGRRLVDLCPAPLAFVSISERLSKTELAAVRRLELQPTLPGFDAAEPPEPKFRIDEFYAERRFPFLPRHKSVSSGGFDVAREHGCAVQDVLEVEFDDRGYSFQVSILFAPMKVQGELRDRYLALITLP